MPDVRPAESASVLSQYLPSPIASASATSNSLVGSLGPDIYRGVDTIGYLAHKMGRQLVAPAWYVVLSYLRALGDYRFNTGLRNINPTDFRYEGFRGSFYHSESRLGRFFQTLFLPADSRGRGLTIDENEAIKTSGLRYRNLASLGYLLPMLTRLGANLYYQGENNAAPLNSDLLAQQWVIGLDTIATGGLIASIGSFGIAQKIAERNLTSRSVTSLLSGSWKIGMAANGFQMGAGFLRLGVEVSHYLDTGHINNSTVATSLGDIFGGASHMAWGNLVLDEAKREAMYGMRAQNHALLGAVEPGSRIKWGMKAANGIGAAIGLGFNIYQFVNAATSDSLGEEERSKQMVSSGIGMIGSLAIGASTLLIGTALAPVAGVAMAVGMTAMVAQTAYDYFA
ncbi:MAG: hypothetical protein A3F82_00500 [Deltaproteobacteria bacterium RIFCSPLOWO2_12_FULL_44_12]|nr:MAG: hypothetical protein A2712_04455 [Deltaproteobacteria bacterium RIFCSPHIGHO2_01_FULL_43_49]OGQ16433.1 MAG: hypothetical protein A3D22_02420 [Deltaproteobacteria bacterium RIFCSPHIGHO2_02_FULL_44_53]OGQ71477.1 MAG: hypothetical protein A3F82_00500 [Deltaproteobacteria bacterium RIFCSPLOWO2_12_FULL_44_12]